MIANLLVESVRHGLMRLVLIALPLAIAGMAFISWWSPELTTEDQALIVLVPLLLFHLTTYLMLVLLTPPQQPPALVNVTPMRAVIAVSLVLGVFFVWLAPMFLLSIPIYRWLGLAISVSGGLFLALAVFLVGFAFLAFVIAIIVLRVVWTRRDDIGQYLRRNISPVALKVATTLRSL